MLILSCMATYFFRPSKAAFFDKYSDSSKRPSTSHIAPTASPNPFACYPALEATMTDELEFPPKKASIASTKKPSKIFIAEKESKVTCTTTTHVSGEKPKSSEPEKPQQISPNGNEQTKTPAPTTTTATTITPLHISKIDPNSTPNVEILQVEPTQEITDKIT